MTACMRHDGTALPSGCLSAAEPHSALTDTGDSSCSFEDVWTFTPSKRQSQCLIAELRVQAAWPPLGHTVR